MRRTKTRELDTQRRDAENRFKGDSINMIRREFASVSDIRSERREVDEVPFIGEFNHDHVDRVIANRRTDVFDRNNREEYNKLRKLLMDSVNDEKVARELADYRQFELTADVMAAPFALAAFQEVPLQPNELPMIVRPRSRNMQRFTVRRASIDGGQYSDQWQTTKDATTAEMDLISTDRVEYTLMDIQQGNVSEFDAINQEMQYDMEMKVDALAKTNIDAAQTASGLRDNLSIHPLVQTDTIPDTNYLDLNAIYPGADNVLTIEKLKYILNHIALLEAAFQKEGLKMQSIQMSPLNLRDAWDFTDLVYDASGSEVAPKQTVTTPVREQIFNTGAITNAWGMTFSWVPNTQIARGRMYVFFNQPLGWLFTKSEFDKLFKWDETNSQDHAESNMGETMWRRCLAFYTPDLWKYRILIIDL